jgi:uncharacterized Zn finger protein
MGVRKSLVQGSTAKPYKVVIDVKPLPGDVWKQIKKTCEGKIESLPELIAGKFPKELGELFATKGKGLFPAPREIKFNCSCPDWAVLCKHVAAVLYGVGARLDENPALFFTLRGVKIEELISEAIQTKTQSLLGKSGTKSRRVLEDIDVTAVFGVEVAAAEAAPDEQRPETVKPAKRRGRPKKRGTSTE